MQEQTALQHINARKQQILSQITGEHTQILEKAITPQEFKVEYSTGHEVFDAQSLSKYVTDSMAQSTEENPAQDILKGLEDEFNTLTPIFVKEGEGETLKVSKLYVRKV